MGNANSYNHASLRQDGVISRRRRRMNDHPDSPHIALNDDHWLDNDQSVSSTEANEPPHDYDDDAPLVHVMMMANNRNWGSVDAELILIFLRL